MFKVNRENALSNLLLNEYFIFLYVTFYRIKLNNMKRNSE